MAGTRYVRYILLSVICLVIIFFISSSSSGPAIEKGSSVVHSQYDKIIKGWRPSTGTDRYPDEKPLSDPTYPDSADEKAADSEQGKKDEDKTLKDVSTGKVGDHSKGEKPSKDGKTKENKPYTGGKASKEDSDKIPTKKPPHDTTPNKQDTLGSAKSQEPKMNATFVTLARNSDIWEISKSIRSVEDRFNHRFNYDWVFLNDKEFDEDFKRITTNLVSGTTRYGQISEEHWSFPEWIDQEKAAETRKDMAERKIIYGDSISYRHMCRYESGFFYRHPLMLEYEWYWRVEPSIELYCDIGYDTFRYMAENEKKYSFVLSLYEYHETIPTIWDSVRTFMKEHPEHVAKGNSLDFLSEDGGKSYNNCHFWSNFEIGNLNWLRSEGYSDFFDRLDRDGGFFYERWGDAPVHSIGAGILLPKEQIHFFNDIAYYHVPFTHCPTEEKVRMDRKCSCNPSDNFDWQDYSCTARWYDINNMKKPKGYEDQKG